MRRKLVQHGEKTLMVSLPAKWLQTQNLKKGDEVVLAPENSSITISKETLLDTVHRIKISIKLESSLHVHAVLSNAYKLGYDEIAVEYSGKAQLALIKKEVGRMIGFEIVSLTSDTCKIKSVIKSTVEEYENIKKRSWFSIKSAFDTLVADLKRGKMDNYSVILELYDNTLKFTDFCRRLINKHMFLDVKNACLEYSVLLKLLYSMPLIKETYISVKEKRVKPGNDFIDFAKKCETYFNLCYDAYHKKDPELASRIVTEWDAIDAQGNNLLKKYGISASKLLELIRLCRGFGGHIIAQHYLTEFKE
ncbi:AbrB/MazE/SpoVT family DNA-binding domain-containing protein [Candidatus Woesearchaeota archaeon]|nr:AbrB/MazE/SpoVT family DNA-binding domain-containing protein [Candidatus Woesearchaeota archaeon]MBW3006447.1 AbrB/MazE/SpoVT family DNA-binding domain-containing protein [Candidatus Woesearchaeota archaeon]